MANFFCRVAFFLVTLLSFSVLASETADSSVPDLESLAVLVAQMEVVKSYQDTFVSIVLWSLGSVLAMALGLAAFNWYSSRVIYERDIQALRHENQAVVRVIEAELKGEFSEFFQSLEKSLSSSVDAMEKDVEGRLNGSLNSQSLKIESLKKRIVDLEFEVTKIKAESALKENRLSWAIYQYLDLLLISVEQGSCHYEAGDILDVISEILDLDDASIPSEYVTKAIDVFDSLPQGYRVVGERLLSKFHDAARGV
jgi:hypothetical protein